jgi:hypothetical protein
VVAIRQLADGDHIVKNNTIMTTTALIMWLVSNVIVTAFTIYFFIKVVRTPDKTEQDFPPGP